ncbi:zinc finger, CCHC-type containing protein [Tanacetum coccineum]
MGDENPIRTLGDYSKPSHEGYKNTIELPVGNNVVPLRHHPVGAKRMLIPRTSVRGSKPTPQGFPKTTSNWLERLPAGSITTWKDLTTQFLAQFFPPRRTAKLRNDILMFQQHHGESISKAWTRFKDLLRKVPHHCLDLWLQIQIFYDHVDGTTQKGIDYANRGRLRKLRPDEAWSAIESPDIMQLLGIMEHKVDTLMKDAISLMKKSESVFRLTANEIYQPHSEPSRQEEFEHIVMNFIFDQEERITQLEDYMQVTAKEFMEFSSEVTRRLKKRIKENENKPRKIEKITKYPDTKVLENNAKHEFLENLKKKVFPTPANFLYVRHVLLIHSNPSQPRNNIFGFKPGERANLSRHSSSNSLTIQLPTQNDTTFTVDDLIKRDPSLTARLHTYEPLHKGVTFRDVATLSGLRNAETVNATRLTHSLWPSIGDGMKETTNRVTEIDLFYLYYIFGEGVVCNIPYWLAKYLKSIRDKSVIFRKVFVTRIAWYFGLLTNEMVSVLNREPPPHVYRKTSLIKMGVIMELHEGECYWPATREVMEEGGGDYEEGDEEGGNEGVGGSADIYRNMSQGDWQVRQARWIDQHDAHWGRINAWMGKQDERAHWMYDHTVRQLPATCRTATNLEPPQEIDPFPGFEADYPTYGYQGHMPPGYTYRPYPPQDDSS